MTQEEMLARIRELYRELQREFRGQVETKKYHALVRQIRQLTDAYRQAETVKDTGMSKIKDEQAFHDRHKGVPPKLRRKVYAALIASGQSTTLDADCTLCNDAQWWIDNGFTMAERRAFCESIGCTIPPDPAE